MQPPQQPWRNRASRASAAALLLTAAATAQPTRTRTLTYDPARQEWAEVPPPPPGTPDGDLHHIRLQIEQESFREALNATAAFEDTYGRSHALFPEILLARAEAHIGRGHFDEAHAVLQTFLAEFAGIRFTPDALRLEFVVAEAYLRGAKRKVLGLRWFSAKDLGYRILDEISTDFPDSEHAELAIKTKADHLFNDGEYALAEIEYGRLLNEYPESRYRPHALARSAEAALAGFAGVDYDEAALIEAQDRFADFRSRYPIQARRIQTDAILESIREMRAEKDFRIGQYYERTRHLASAIFYYEQVRKNWPDSIAASKAARQLELLGVLEQVAPRDQPP